MAEIKSESVADFIPESVADLPRNTHTPLIEPDMQISRIRLSDKTSRLFACNALCSA